MVSAHEDPSAPGGAVHSGAFILIDKQKRIRGYYDGTKEEEVDKLMKDMDLLLKEESTQDVE
jgi:protein SCO1/2